MAKIKSASEGCGAEAIEAKTGQTWEFWKTALTRFDVGRQGHQAAAAFLEQEHAVDPWWAQQLTVRFEQETGLRQPGQRSDGTFAVNVSRTVAVPPEAAFEAWSTEAGWNAWFTTGAKIDFRVAGSYVNADKDQGVFKRIRSVGGPNGQGEVARIDFSWDNEGHCPGTTVSVQFIVKAPGKTQVTVTHEKLPDRAGCEDMKEGWTWALMSLKSYLEDGGRLSFEDWKATRDKGV